MAAADNAELLDISEPRNPVWASSVWSKGTRSPTSCCWTWFWIDLAIALWCNMALDRSGRAAAPRPRYGIAFGTKVCGWRSAAADLIVAAGGGTLSIPAMKGPAATSCEGFPVPKERPPVFRKLTMRMAESENLLDCCHEVSGRGLDGPRLQRWRVEALVGELVQGRRLVADSDADQG